MLRTKLILILVALLTVFGLSGCRDSAQDAQTTDSRPDINVMLEPMRPAVVGATVLTVKLSTADGLPITDAQRVAVKGDMTHAGMAPVFGVAEEAMNGDYRIAFEWTMAGDWILTVDVTLADGTTLTREFTITIPSE